MGAAPTGRSVRRFAAISSFVLVFCALAAAGVWVLRPAEVAPPAEVASATEPAPARQVSPALTTPTTRTTASSDAAYSSDAQATPALAEGGLSAPEPPADESEAAPIIPRPDDLVPTGAVPVDDAGLSDGSAGVVEPEKVSEGTSSAPAKKGPPGPPVAQWTVMVYIGGDNDLERSVVPDIETELCVPGSNADVNVVCLADRHPGYDKSAGDWTTTKLFYCTEGMTATPENAVADWGERNTADPQTLTDFVLWTQANYPAEHYAIFFWDHGWMWRPDKTLRDDTSGGDGMNEDEFLAAMSAEGVTPIDVAGWDMCERQTIEVAATWASIGAAAVVGSEEDEWWEGVQYDLVVAALEADPAMGPDEMAVAAASTPGGDNRTYSALALDGRWDGLIGAVDAFAWALEAGLPLYRDAYDDAALRIQDYGDRDNRDLYDLAHEIALVVDDPVVRATAQGVMDAVDEAVLFSMYRSERYRDSHGVSIWWPRTYETLTYTPNEIDNWAFYQTMEFAKATHWDEFLAAYAE
jgi:hypothetical protein